MQIGSESSDQGGYRGSAEGPSQLVECGGVLGADRAEQEA
jgi:hypothetical protein